MPSFLWLGTHTCPVPLCLRHPAVEHVVDTFPVPHSYPPRLTLLNLSAQVPPSVGPESALSVHSPTSLCPGSRHLLLELKQQKRAPVSSASPMSFGDLPSPAAHTPPDTSHACHLAWLLPCPSVAQSLTGSVLPGASRPEALLHHWTRTVRLVCSSQQSEPKSFRDSSRHGSLLKYLSIFLSFPHPWCLFPVSSHWTETETKTFLKFRDSVISQARLMSA